MNYNLQNNSLFENSACAFDGTDLFGRCAKTYLASLKRMLPSTCIKPRARHNLKIFTYDCQLLIQLTLIE